MDLNWEIILPGLISGILIGMALVVSRLFRMVLVTTLALFLIWIFYESGEPGIVDTYTQIYERVVLNQMFFIPLTAGLVLGLIFKSEGNS